MTQNNPQNFQRGTVASDEVGYLTVRVSTAGGAIPLERASVHVRSSDLSQENVIYSLITNSDGLTPTVSLPTPPRSAGIVPQDTVVPYAVYNVDVYADGYVPALFTNVPVFPGITSVQGAILLPQMEGSQINGARIVNEAQGFGEDAQ